MKSPKLFFTNLLLRYVIKPVATLVIEHTMGDVIRHAEANAKAVADHQLRSFLEDADDRVTARIEDWKNTIEEKFEGLDDVRASKFRSIVKDALEEYLGSNEAERMMKETFEDMELHEEIAYHLDKAELRDILEETDDFLDGIADKAVERIIERLANRPASAAR